MGPETRARPSDPGHSTPTSARRTNGYDVACRKLSCWRSMHALPCLDNLGATLGIIFKYSRFKYSRCLKTLQHTGNTFLVKLTWYMDQYVWREIGVSWQRLVVNVSWWVHLRKGLFWTLYAIGLDACATWTKLILEHTFPMICFMQLGQSQLKVSSIFSVEVDLWTWLLLMSGVSRWWCSGWTKDWGQHSHCGADPVSWAMTATECQSNTIK